MKALFTSVFCTSTKTPTDASTRDNSSTARIAVKKFAPAPPNSSGVSMPIKPRSKHCLMIAGSSFATSSMCSTRGRNSPSANSRTLPRNIVSSSVSVVSGLGVGGAMADWDWLMFMLYYGCRNGTLHHKLILLILKIWASCRKRSLDRMTGFENLQEGTVVARRHADAGCFDSEPEWEQEICATWNHLRSVGSASVCLLREPRRCRRDLLKHSTNRRRLRSHPRHCQCSLHRARTRLGPLRRAAVWPSISRRIRRPLNGRRSRQHHSVRECCR